ncbi:MAG: GAF domain-containing protein [Candidatus Eremiobacteraeota bacterium]|nr:GAF domain-containing protein [Candidatus Eremiobacteraeota bacterium]MCW5867356.1 GAF domain-containing protein [Candidatus Eremiobacteraeota bacterium]
MDLDEFSGLLTAGQRLIVLYRRGGAWHTSSHGSDWDFSAGTARLCLLQEADRTAAPVIVMDAHKDERVAQFPPAPFRSALCCPVLSGASVLGLVWIEDSNPRAFTFEHLNSWMVRSGALTEQLKTPPVPPRNFTRPLVFLGLAVSLLSFPFWFGSRAPVPRAGPKIVTLSSGRAPAATVAESYLAGLRSGNLPGAYRLLSRSVQEKWSEARFVRQTQGWLAASDRAWGLKFRQVQVVRAGPMHCQVRVIPLGQAAKQEHWTWDLVKEEAGWRLETPPS